MSEIRIFVEGDSDKKFLSDLLNHIGVESANFRIDKLNGKDDDKFEKTINLFHVGTGSGTGKNLVIIDADEDDLGSRRTHLNNLKDKFKVEFDLFLLPNNKDKGELETLLRSIVHDRYNSFFETCLNSFNGCISELNVGLNKMSLKDQVYNYLCAHLTKEESDQRGPLISPSQMNYMNDRFWDIESEKLLPLKNFLKGYFQ